MNKLNTLLSFIEKQFESFKIVTISASDLEKLLKNLQIVFEKDTLLQDEIRIMKFHNASYVVQEKSPKDELLLRQFKTEKLAKDFVMDRLHIYDKMWDGCGCKINYYK